MSRSHFLITASCIAVLLQPTVANAQRSEWGGSCSDYISYLITPSGQCVDLTYLSQVGSVLIQRNQLIREIQLRENPFKSDLSIRRYFGDRSRELGAEAEIRGTIENISSREVLLCGLNTQIISREKIVGSIYVPNLTLMKPGDVSQVKYLVSFLPEASRVASGLEIKVTDPVFVGSDELERCPLG